MEPFQILIKDFLVDKNRTVKTVDCPVIACQLKQKGDYKTMLNQYEDIITVEELCEILKTGKNRVYELLQTNQIRAFRLGRNWKIPKISVEHYLEIQSGISKSQIKK